MRLGVLGRWGFGSVVFALGVIGFVQAAVAVDANRLPMVRSKYYFIHSDLSDELIVDLGTRMDAMYAEYSRRMSDFDLKAETKPLDVYLFNSKKDYVTFTGGKYGNTGGVFVAGKHELAAFLDGQRDTLRRTLQHEAFHQFAFKAVGPNMPVWLNEGMAQLFEEAIWTGETFMMNQVPPRRLRQLQSDIKNNKLLPMKTLLGMTSEQWATNLASDSSVGSSQYNQAWAVTHFMAYGDEGRNGAKLVMMLKLLSKDVEAGEAFREAYGGNVEAFRVAFEKHAMAMQATAEAALIDRHEVLADLMCQLAERGKRFKSVAEFRATVDQMNYRLKYTRGQVSWTSEPAGYFRDGKGQPFGEDQLFFENRRGAPLPDLVLRHPSQRLSLRARFIESGGKIEHEVVAEPPGR